MARAGFYQTSGAFGFRDQLQDVLALLWSDPGRTRAQILLAATRQFEEGTCSTGGTRRLAAACALGARMTSSGCPS
jgi:hypothetical protein